MLGIAHICAFMSSMNGLAFFPMVDSLSMAVVYACRLHLIAMLRISYAVKGSEYRHAKVTKIPSTIMFLREMNTA